MKKTEALSCDIDSSCDKANVAFLLADYTWDLSQELDVWLLRKAIGEVSSYGFSDFKHYRPMGYHKHLHMRTGLAVARQACGSYVSLWMIYLQFIWLGCGQICLDCLAQGITINSTVVLTFAFEKQNEPQEMCKHMHEMVIMLPLDARPWICKENND